MSFATNLRRFRIRKRYSLQKLADAVKVSKAHIWDLETERARNPTLEVLEKLSSVLEVPINSLVGENPDDDAAPRESVVLFRNLQALDPEDFETIRLMTERLKKSQTCQRIKQLWFRD